VIFKKDNLKIGIVYGLIAPLLAMFIYYFIVFADKITISEYFFYLRTNISLVANAILFTVFINTYRDKSAKGVFVITLVYGIAVLLIKLFA